MDAQFSRSEHSSQGTIRVLGENFGSANYFNSSFVTHIFNTKAPPPKHWTCPHQKTQGFIPPEGSVEGILSRPGETLAGLRSNNFDGIAFHGQSGVGKTQAAIRFIERYRRHTYDVFWVDASTPSTLAKDFQHIIGLLKNGVSGDTGTLSNLSNRTGGNTGKRFPIPQDPVDETAMKNINGSTVANGISSQENLLSAVKSELESPSTGRWLLILDNLTEETAIAKFLPKSTNGTTIVTTRSLHLASRLSYLAIEVPRMSPTNAALLFETKYRNPEESVKQDEAMELMELLEYLPARIVDVALHLSENRVSVREYMAELKAARRLAEMSSRHWRRFGLDEMYGCWSRAVAAAWGCLVLFSVLCAWTISFRRG